MGARPSIEDLIAFTARLDALRPDQHPDDLSIALRAAFKELELYNVYVSFIVRGAERVKGLLEVFDKARSVTFPSSQIDFQRLCSKQVLTANVHDITIVKQFRQLCDQTGLLPTSPILPENHFRHIYVPAASDGFGDAEEAIYDGKRVSIKALHVRRGDTVHEVKQVPYQRFLIHLTPPVDHHHQVLCKTVAMQMWISHPNIVPLLGVSEAPEPLCVVSEWMPKGNVRDYVRNNPEASRLQLVCRPESASDFC